MTNPAFDDLPATLRHYVGELKLAVCPALPEADPPIVVTWPDDNWREFVDLAARVDAGVIYIHESVLSEDDLPDPEESTDPEQRRVRDIADVHLGQSCEVHVGFAHAGVWHRWSAIAPWFIELDALHPFDDDDPHDDDVANAAEEAELAALAPTGERFTRELLANPQFIGAVNGREWEAACAQIPEIREWHDAPADPDNPALSRARRRTATLAFEAARRALPPLRAERERRARERLPELADLLLDDPLFRETGDKRVHRRRAIDLLVRELGVRSADIIDSLIHLAREKKARLSSTGGQLPL